MTTIYAVAAGAFAILLTAVGFLFKGFSKAKEETGALKEQNAQAQEANKIAIIVAEANATPATKKDAIEAADKGEF